MTTAPPAPGLPPPPGPPLYLWTQTRHTIADWWRCLTCPLSVAIECYDDPAPSAHVTATGHTVTIIHQTVRTLDAVGITAPPPPAPEAGP